MHCHMPKQTQSENIWKTQKIEQYQLNFLKILSRNKLSSVGGVKIYVLKSPPPSINSYSWLKISKIDSHFLEDTLICLIPFDTDNFFTQAFFLFSFFPEKHPSSHTVRKLFLGIKSQVSLILDPNNCILEFTNGDDYAMGYMGVKFLSYHFNLYIKFQIALQSAFYELLHAKSFASGLEDVISRGGDTDTNGCIVAALLGAYFGIDTIPQEWVNTVRSADPYLGCRDKERYKIPMDFLSIKDIETLVPRLTNIKMS